MPPGQHHAVFTPVAGFSRGGRYFNLDTMHLTELSRFVARKIPHKRRPLWYLGNALPYGYIVDDYTRVTR